MEITFLGQKLRLEIVIISMIVGAFIAINVWCSCAGGLNEGFQAGSLLAGAALDYSIGNGVRDSWDSSHKHATTGNYNSWYAHLDSNKGGPVPLPEGELYMFAKNKIDPSCCPSTYTSSTGCVCVSPEQLKYLNERGGNRTLNTEF